jgi:hypothetical protein
LLTAISWTGAAGDNLWHTPGNWSGGAVPTSADDVTVDVAANPEIMFTSASGSRSVNSLVLRENLHIAGGTLSVVTTATATSTVSMESGTLNGGAWDVTGGTLRGTNSGGNLTDMQVNGDLIMDSISGFVRVTGTTRFTAARLRENSSSIQFAPGYTLADLVVAEGAPSGRGASWGRLAGRGH